MTFMKKNAKLLIVGTLAVIILGLAAGIIPLQTAGFLSISSIKVQVTNPDDPGTAEYEGAYWVIAALTNAEFDFQTYTFDKSESQRSYSNATSADGATLEPQAGVMVKIIPGQPYYDVPLQQSPNQLVVPKTYGAYINKLTGAVGKRSEAEGVAQSVSASYWTLTGAWAWNLHTPFVIEVYKNGVLLDSASIDTLGQSFTEWLENPADSHERMSITDLGKIGTGYNPPTNPELIIIGDLNHIYRYDVNVPNYIRYDASQYSYSNYWYGGGAYYTSGYPSFPATGSQILRWSDDNSPAHWYGDHFMVDENQFPGSTRDDDQWNWRVKPTAPDVFSDKPALDPYGLSLVSYLEQKRGVQKVDWSGVTWLQRLEITSDNYLRAYMPRGAASSLITISISTELADTIAFQLPVAIPQITNAKWISTQTSTGAEIFDQDTVQLTVKNIASVRGTVAVTVRKYPYQPPNAAPCSINPPAASMIIDANIEYTFNFVVKNLGTATDFAFSLNFTAYDSGGMARSSVIVTGTLLKSGEATASLLVHVQDRVTSAKLTGIFVTALFPDQTTKSGYTDNGDISIDMGTFTGTVQVTSSATDKYKSSATSLSIESGKVNEAYLYLDEIGTPPPTSDWTWLLWVLLGSGIILTVFGVVYKKRRKLLA